jgi:NTP pyrophosphatase (non-canonical NTP hydrolase)
VPNDPFTGLQAFQADHKQWVDRNFPGQLPHQPLLGLAEEVGELSHAHLKSEQNIRGSEREHRDAAGDAIGDIVIYLASYCNTNGYDLAACVRTAWQEVSARDWVKNPVAGVGVEPPYEGTE